MPPGLAAVSQTSNAQASEDDLDDLPSFKKTGYLVPFV
ncbi:hypothetical protein GXM_09895 [Nostoc sphaeroides CCNUC1]|uniref:Uncharacterized protein n=1 Tax=Nostoc sphaeroides CCNUC1 TaxID=2653204 RepID=A0A5P8WIJ6_9NOSO|nr:hypothetical protein GXM_09895 [Nostoc sphaeroides CCNUC1]